MQVIYYSYTTLTLKANNAFHFIFFRENNKLLYEKEVYIWTI